MATLILPCAGKNTRFPNSRPKWSLTHPSGNWMLIESLLGLNLENYELIVAVFLKMHLDSFNLRSGVIKALEALGRPYEIVELERETSSQSETVVKAIEQINITGQILVKDCDAFFLSEYQEGNFVHVHSLQQVGNVNASSKSYVDIDTNNLVKTIVEKEVISNAFCCGGYGFSEASKFLETYKYVSSLQEEEIYVSHIIYQLILEGENFKAYNTDGFKDWGTIVDWNAYKKQYKTLFLDIDGVLVENSGELSAKPWGSTSALINNKNYINKLYNTGKVRIILTTSRRSDYRKVTLDQLDNLEIKYHDIIFDLPHCQRIVINDFASSNPYPTSAAINLPRDDDNLENYLAQYFGDFAI